MTSEVHSMVLNYYEHLNVPQGATAEDIEKALGSLRVIEEARLNNQLTMHGARQVINEVIPAIRLHLLSGEQARAEYDQQLLAAQQRIAHRDELADNEGLDDPLRQPFFFDPFDGYDTESPAFSLRQIAMKLDEEWAQARTWIIDTSEESHLFVGFLVHAAGRQHLAQRIEQIIEAVTHKKDQHMDINEAIERCINILDPQIDRPVVDIHNTTFDGRVLDAGDFVSDQPAQTELILAHSGTRGCVFGVVESQTDWLRLQGNQTSVRFSLLPEGTDPQIGASQVKIPLFFQVTQLSRDTYYTAQLIFRLENRDQTIEFPITVQIHLLPLPPRVSFESVTTVDITRRGVHAKTIIIPHNSGDEHLVPLTARLSTSDPAAIAEPTLFRANEPITFTINTRDRPFGSKYEVVFHVDYGPTPGAIGPSAVHIQGEILPAVWQSMRREKDAGQRAGTGCVGGFVGFLLVGSIGAGLAGHIAIAWLLFLVLPAMFALAVRPGTVTMVTHIQRSGNNTVTFEKVPTWVLWSLPLGLGLLLALVCVFLPNGGLAFLIGGIVGGVVGTILGFIVDQTTAYNNKERVERLA